MQWSLNFFLHTFCTRPRAQLKILDAAGVPLFVCLVRNDDTSALNDTLTWNGKNFVVKRVLEARFRGEVSAKMLVLAQGLAVG